MQLETKAPEPEANRTGPQTQPIGALEGLDPMLDENAIRQAIVHADANNLDPQTLTLQDLAQVQGQNKETPVASPVEVPQKFLKPDGAVDVDKIQASTKALEEGIQKKEEAIHKVNLTVEELVRQNQELEKQFRAMPNAEKLTSSLPPVRTTETPSPNFEQVVHQDFQRDPLGTWFRLNELQIEQKLSPFKEREKLEEVRKNYQAIAEKDNRILQPEVFSAVKQKLQRNPEFWLLPNPQRAAFLEVKEELRLGEPSPVPTQPSRPLSPVLGGGTPPSAPLSSVQAPQDVLSNLHKLDIRDRKQEELGDEAIRKALMGLRG